MVKIIQSVVGWVYIPDRFEMGGGGETTRSGDLL